MTDYNQIIIDIGKAKNIHDVVGVQENGKDVFDRGEKIKFINSLLGKVPEEQLKRTQETAVLFVKVKQARQLRKKDLRLRNELDKEKADNSIAYQVLNDRDELVDEAIDHINLLEHFGIPEGKTKIQERIDKIEPEIEKLKRSQSEKNKIRRKYSATERLEKEKIENAKATLRKKENLLVVLQAMMDANNTDASNREITNEDGTKTRLGNLTANITINDYTGKGLTESKIDSSGNPTYEPVDTTSSVVTKTALKCIRENALGFLNSIVRKTSEPTYFETSVDNSHNQRRFNAKVNYHIVDSFSWSFFKVLREIGFTKLEKVIEASSNKSSDKKKLKKYAEEIIEFITPEEAMFGIKDYVAHSLVLKNTQDYYALAKSYDRFQKTLISKKLNEFPYEPKPNWKKVFELMHKVFPAIYSGSKWEVSSQPYLDNSNDPNYLKPNNGKDWSSKLFLNGLAKNVKLLAPSSYYGPEGGGTYKWIDDNASSEPLLKQQSDEVVYELKSDVNFKSLVKIWWDSLGSLIDTTNYDWNSTGSGSDVTHTESNLSKLQNSIRFVKTVQQILLKMNLIREASELDYYLLEVADMKEKGSWINPRKSITKDLVKAGDDEGRKLILANKIWSEDFSKLGDPGVLLNDISKDRNYIAYLESGGTKVSDLVKKLAFENADLQSQIDEYELELQSLRIALLDEDLPPEDKKKKFMDVYNAKGNDKWTLAQVEELIARGNLLKKELSDDEWNTDIKSKQDEVKVVKKAVEDSGPGHLYDFYFFKGLGEDDKTRAKEVRKLKKDGSIEKDLADFKNALQGISQHIKLDKSQQDALDAIQHEIANPTSDEDDTGDLKNDEVRSALDAPAGVVDSDLKTSEWKNTPNFKTQTKIDDLVKDYRPNSTDQQKVGAFKEHLKHENWGAKWGGAKIEGDNYWETFVKKGPEFIIGAIKHYEWENKQKDYRTDVAHNGVITEMQTANNLDNTEEDDKKIKVTEKWDTEKASHIAQFLYKKAIGKTGKDLIKKHELVDKDQQPTPNTEDKKWWEKAFYWPAWTSAIVIGGGVTVWAFWDNIKGWWEPKEEDTDEDSEN